MRTNPVLGLPHRERRRRGNLAVALVALALVGALGAGAGNAGTRSGAAPTCTVPAASAQPFLNWHDQGNYFPAPAGSFENGLTGWSTQGDVSIADGNESYDVGAPSDSHSLSLFGWSSATTPPICVSVFSPDLRLFVQNGGWRWAALRVSVNYTDQWGNARTAPVGWLFGGSSWSLSPRLFFIDYIAPAVGGQGQTTVSFTFAPLGGKWKIDDLYVDPLKNQ